MQIVPQYIDVEDKIVGPLTWKHLGWAFGGAGIMLIAFVVLDKMTFFIVMIPIGLSTAALAFYRPNGVALSEFLGYGFTYLFRSKTYTWQREVMKEKKKKKKEVKIATTSGKKQLTVDDVAAMAQTLDSGGRQRSERIRQLIKERTNNEKNKK